MEFLLSKVNLFIIVLVRISTIIVILPIFGYRVIPTLLKLSFALLLTFIIVQLLPTQLIIEPQNFWVFIYMIIKEVPVGLIIGFVTNIIFMAFQFGGTIVGMQMGFGIVNVVDPQSNIQISIIGQFMYIVALLIFLAINGHYFLLQALMQSFNMIPLTGAIFNGQIVEQIVKMSADLFVIAIKIGIPTIVALLLTEAALGIIARTVPQMNIFIVGFPLKIGLGLFTLATSFPLLLYLFNKLIIQFKNDVITIIKLL